MKAALRFPWRIVDRRGRPIMLPDALMPRSNLRLMKKWLRANYGDNWRLIRTVRRPKGLRRGQRLPSKWATYAVTG